MSIVMCENPVIILLQDLLLPKKFSKPEIENCVIVYFKLLHIYLWFAFDICFLGFVEWKKPHVYVTETR